MQAKTSCSLLAMVARTIGATLARSSGRPAWASADAAVWPPCASSRRHGAVGVVGGLPEQAIVRPCSEDDGECGDDGVLTARDVREGVPHSVNAAALPSAPSSTVIMPTASELVSTSAPQSESGSALQATAKDTNIGSGPWGAGRPARISAGTAGRPWRARRRQAESWCGIRLWRRATSWAESSPPRSAPHMIRPPVVPPPRLNNITLTDNPIPTIRHA